MNKNSTFTIGIIAAAAAILYFLNKSGALGTSASGNALASTTSPLGSASGVLTPIAGALNALSTLSAFNEEPTISSPAVIAAGSAGGISNPGSNLQLQQIQTSEGIQTVGLLNTSTGETTSFVPQVQDTSSPTISTGLIDPNSDVSLYSNPSLSPTDSYDFAL